MCICFWSWFWSYSSVWTSPCQPPRHYFPKHQLYNSVIDFQVGDAPALGIIHWLFIPKLTTLWDWINKNLKKVFIPHSKSSKVCIKNSYHLGHKESHACQRCAILVLGIEKIYQQFNMFSTINQPLIQLTHKQQMVGSKCSKCIHLDLTKQKSIVWVPFHPNRMNTIIFFLQCFSRKFTAPKINYLII